MNCPSCGSQVPDQSAFCPRCGHELHAAPPTLPVEKAPAQYCPACGAGLRAEDAFCWRCGARTVPAPRPPRRLPAMPRYGWSIIAVLGLLVVVLAVLAIAPVVRTTAELDRRYDRGLDAMRAEDYNAAIDEFQAVVGRDPEYRDAAALLVQVQTTAVAVAELQECDRLYAQAQAYCSQEQWPAAIIALEELKATTPDYQPAAVDGLLFTAYAGDGRSLAAAGQYRQAVQRFEAALAIRADDRVAGEKEQAVVMLTPTATPTPMPSPTLTLTPSPTPTPTLAPSPTATPTPTGAPARTATSSSGSTPKCRKAAKGLIGFMRYARCGPKSADPCPPSQVWVMNGDGSGQAPMCNPQAYQWALARDHTANDGSWDVRVSPERADIMRLYLTTGQREMIIVNNAKDWDPVLSADNWWLAWTTNRNGNDEIFIKSLDPHDQNQRRLTVNAWEWDKHPTWSPDGRRIAFFSNRGDSLGKATCQIWVMDIVNDRGTNLRNLSNQFDRVDQDPVWFKWDDIP